jgi:hypothetical protein
MFTAALAFLKFVLGKFGFLSFIPSLGALLGALGSLLTPVVGGIIDLLKWLLATLWEGFKDMTDNAASIIFVVFLVLASTFYTTYVHTPKLDACETEIVKMRKQIDWLKKTCGRACTR